MAHLVAFVLLRCAAPIRIGGAAVAVKILALDTSSQCCSVALQLDGRERCRETLAGRRHSELVLPMIDGVLQEGGVRLRELDAIAFGAGPGSFTGLRIACGVAQGLAFAAELPVAPVSTLLALALRSGRPKVIACLDARMGQIYLAAYEHRSGEWQTVAEPCLCTPQAAPAVDGGDWVGAGSGFAVLRAALEQRYAKQLSGIEAELHPHAREIGRLGAAMLRAGSTVPAERAHPVYLRDRVALTVAERRVLKTQSGDTATPAP